MGRACGWVCAAQLVRFRLKLIPMRGSDEGACIVISAAQVRWQGHGAARRAAAHLEESEQHFEHQLLPHHLRERLPHAVVPSVLEEERPDHREAEGDEPFRGVDLMVKGRACVG